MFLRLDGSPRWSSLSQVVCSSHRFGETAFVACLAVAQATASARMSEGWWNQIFTSWNPLIRWLRQIEALKTVAQLRLDAGGP